MIDRTRFSRISLSCFCLAMLMQTPATADELGTRRVRLEAFQPSGLTPAEYADPDRPDLLPANTQYPPTGRNLATLTRTANCVEYTVKTSGLPPGAYTNWLLVLNKPDKCDGSGDCGLGEFFDDLFNNPSTDGAAFWSTGGVVGANGLGDFSRRVCKGDDLGFPGDWMIAGDVSRCKHDDACAQPEVIGPQHLFGELKKPVSGAFAVIIKYHGAASDDSVELYDQTHTLLGSCAAGANGHPGAPPIVQCFDPQIAIFSAN